MTNHKTSCSPNNFAMLGRIARYELNATEYYLYGTLIDMAVNNRVTKSNKKMAKAIKASVNTYKAHRDALWRKGYICLYYRDEDDHLTLLKFGMKAETFSSLTIEIVDIWEANLLFQTMKPDSSDATPNLQFLQCFSHLKTVFPSPCRPMKGVKIRTGGYQSVDRGGSKSEQGGISQLIGGGQPVDPNSNKDIKELKDKEKKKKKELSAASADEEIFVAKNLDPLTDSERQKVEADLGLIFGEGDPELDVELDVLEDSTESVFEGLSNLVAEMTGEQAEESEVEADPVPEIPQYWEMELMTDFSDTPFTEAEYRWFAPWTSHGNLSQYVLNPCWTDAEGISPGSWVSRDSYQVSGKKLSEWQKMIAVVQHYFPVGGSVGYATKIAQQLYGTAKNGQRKFCIIDPAMTAVEACAFAYWLQVAKDLDQLPERAERIQERVMQFRALPDHFAHVNHARYVLDDLLADPIVYPEPDPEMLKPADPEYAARIIAECSEIMGFPLIGDFG